MRWVKKGLIYKPEGNTDWSKSHAQVPKPVLINDDRLRIYYGTRDALNRTRTSFIEVLPENPKEILYINDEPVMDLGEKQSFDEYGVMPGCILKNRDEVIMYYTGWSKGSDAPYTVQIGMAISKDGGVTFKRFSKDPIIGFQQEKISSSQPFVVIDKNLWKMLYSSFTDWIITDDGKEPTYELHYAESRDGKSWDLKGRILYYEEKAVINPSIWGSHGKWAMLYSYRGLTDFRGNTSNSYRIGYAESQSLKDWNIYSHNPVIDISDEGWDSEMNAYPGVYNYRGKYYLLYNGNGFGKSGFGYAILDE